MEQVIQINKNSLSSLIRQSVFEAMNAFMLDPDFGLELSDATEKKLLLSSNQAKKGKTIPFKAVLKKYKLNS